MMTTVAYLQASEHRGGYSNDKQGVLTVPGVAPFSALNAATARTCKP